MRNNNICTVFDEGPLFEGKNRLEFINFHRIRVRKSSSWGDFTSTWVVRFFPGKYKLNDFSRGKGSNLCRGSSTKILGVL